MVGAPFMGAHRTDVRRHEACGYRAISNHTMLFDNIYGVAGCAQA
jgi:hypothetical protein